jgi:hypothetical protein
LQSITVPGGSTVVGGFNVTGNVGIGRIPDAAYMLDIRNPSTAVGADTYIRLKSNAASGDGDAQIYLDASDTGESAIVFQADGVVTSYLQVINGDDYVQLSNEVAGSDLYLLTGSTSLNDAYALRVTRDSGETVISGVTGTITASALETTITGLSTTTGLYKGMFLTKTAGTGAFGVSTTIKYIDVGASTITIESNAAMTAGSITFTATPNPTTVHIYSLSAGTWTAGQDFARLAFGNGDTSGAGDGGIKASINAYTYDTAGTGSGLDFYVSSNGTTLKKGIRLDENADLQFNSGYGSVATAYGCRAWVNFNGTGTVAIRASGNVSSITDDNTGIYRMNFTTAMSDANYAVCASTAIDRIITSSIASSTTSYADIRTTNLSGTYTDVSANYVSIFR